MGTQAGVPGRLRASSVAGLLYCLSVNPVYLVAVQLLDGIGAGIFGVVSVLVVADLTRGTGRFNLTQGPSRRPPASAPA